MVLKPSKEAPLNAFALAEILHDIGLPRGVFNLVSGHGREIGEALARHSEVDMVSFTGSTNAGVRVSELAAPSVKRVSLELGGKALTSFWKMLILNVLLPRQSTRVLETLDRSALH